LWIALGVGGWIALTRYIIIRRANRFGRVNRLAVAIGTLIGCFLLLSIHSVFYRDELLLELNGKQIWLSTWRGTVQVGWAYNTRGNVQVGPFYSWADEQQAGAAIGSPPPRGLVLGAIPYSGHEILWRMNVFPLPAASVFTIGLVHGYGGGGSGKFEFYETGVLGTILVLSLPLLGWLAVTRAGLLWRPYRERRRLWLESHCHVCGYDLRASPERCPECGTARHSNSHAVAEARP
jgi:hypothetical protein